MINNRIAPLRFLRPYYCSFASVSPPLTLHSRSCQVRLQRNARSAIVCLRPHCEDHQEFRIVPGSQHLIEKQAHQTKGVVVRIIGIERPGLPGSFRRSRGGFDGGRSAMVRLLWPRRSISTAASLKKMRLCVRNKF